MTALKDFMWTIAGLFLRLLPFRFSYFFASRNKLNMLERSVRRAGRTTPELKLIDIVEAAPQKIQKAVDAMGGVLQLEKQMKYFKPRSSGTIFSVAVHSPRSLRRNLKVNDPDGVRKLSNDRGLLLVQPHIGPTVLSQLLLNHEGRETCVTTVLPREAINEIRHKLLLMNPTLPLDKQNFLYVQDPMSAVWALRTLQNGGAFCWQPDVAVISSRSSTCVFDNEVYVSPLVYKLFAKTNPVVAISWARLHPHSEMAAEINFQQIAVDPSATEDTFFGSVYASVEKVILDNIDQWEMWFRPEHAVGLLAYSEANQ